MIHQEHHVYHHHRAAGLLHPLRNLVQNPKWLLRKYLRPADQVLDLGCGPGFFSLRIARMLDRDGHVTAVDIQPEMLRLLEKQCEAQRLSEKITTHLQPSPDEIGLEGVFNFILAFYMLHEVADKPAYLSQIRSLLPPNGLFFLVEPKFVISQGEFSIEVNQAEQQGLKPVISPNVAFSHSMYFSV